MKRFQELLMKDLGWKLLSVGHCYHHVVYGHQHQSAH